MSHPTREPGRMTRVTNPVTPTVHSFSETPQTPGRMTRVSNPVTPTVVTFAPVPELFLVLKKHPESDAGVLACRAAVLIEKVDELDRQLGGPGVVFTTDGTTDEPSQLKLRLLPKVSDGTTAERFERLKAKLNELAGEANAVKEKDIVQWIAKLRGTAAFSGVGVGSR